MEAIDGEPDSPGPTRALRPRRAIEPRARCLFLPMRDILAPRVTTMAGTKTNEQRDGTRPDHGRTSRAPARDAHQTAARTAFPKDHLRDRAVPLPGQTPVQADAR